jgi:hypothetical protein
MIKMWKIIALFALLLIMGNGKDPYASDDYVPEPLLFVHGFGAGKPEKWEPIKEILEQGKLLDSSKYFNSPQLYKIADYYPYKSNDSMHEIGSYLASELDLLYRLHNGRKIRVVTHSAGANAFRYAHSEAKVKDVLFIGAPHLGSPWASVAWLLNNVISGNSDMYYTVHLGAISAGSQVDADSSRIVGFRKIRDDMTQYRQRIEEFLRYFKRDFNIDANGDAIADLRVSDGDVSYTKTFDAYVTEPLFGNTDKYEFVFNANHSPQDIAVLPTPPSVSQSLVGTKGSLFELVARFASFALGGTYAFPVNNGLSDLGAGDGFVTKESQSDVGKVTTYEMTHLSEIKKGTQEIIELIDPAPKVKSIRIIDAPPYSRRSTYNCFVMIKAEEYFLADLEISELKLDAQQDVKYKYLNLMKTLSSDNKTVYMPFKQFGQDFLRKRPFVYNHNQIRDYDLSNTFILDPGEFYIYLTDLSNDKAHTVSITFKNPAGKTTEVSFQFSRPVIKNVKMETMVNEEGILCPKSICVRDPRIDPMPTTGGHGENCESPYDTVSILECEVHDPLFSNVKLDFEVHNFRLGNHRKSRLVKTLATRNVKSGQVIKNPCVWDGTDSRGYRGYYGTDLFIRGFGLSGISNDQPAFALTGDDLSGDCGALTVMGTNFDDENRGDYQLRSFKCDPSFLQPPREFVPQTIQVPYGDARKEEFDAYLVSLGVKQTKEEKKESITPAMHGDRDNVRLSTNYQAPLFTLCVTVAP